MCRSLWRASGAPAAGPVTGRLLCATGAPRPWTPEAAAMLAQEDSALEASLAAAEAAAVHATKQVAHLTTPCP